MARNRVTDNRIIAAFDKKVEYVKASKIVFWKEQPNMYGGLRYEYKNRDLAYHEDWNWLLPVVEQIQHYLYETEDEEYQEEIGDITHALTDLDIEDLHENVVKFIEKYNKKKRED